MSLLQPLLLLAWAATAGAPPSRGPAEEFCREPRTVWCGEAEALRFKDLATNAAPILWFSPDEPLLRGTRTRRIPQKIECARQALDPAEAPSPHGQATVYYQVRRVLVRGAPATATEAAFEDERIPLAVTRKLTLRFFFYYEEDFGFGPHIHDLEGMELQVAIEAGAGGWHRARLLSTKAYAHTSDWQANILQVPEDVVLPLTVLVEEGKHASCPDRNGDGIYTPGYDVNVRVNDAWGVRDIFRSRITGARFRSEEFKPRTKTEDGFKIGPPGKDLTEFAVEQRSRYTAKGFELPTKKTYTLVSAHTTCPCRASWASAWGSALGCPTSRSRTSVWWSRWGWGPSRAAPSAGGSEVAPDRSPSSGLRGGTSGGQGAQPHPPEAGGPANPFRNTGSPPCFRG